MMGDSRSTERTLLRWSALATAALAVGLLALNLTAVPVIFDVSLAGFVVACLSAILSAILMFRRRGSLSGPARASVVAGLGVALACALIAAYLSFLSFTKEDMTIRNGDVSLAGTLYGPPTPGPHPAAVILHGSGPESRGQYAYYARRLARAGIASLVFDKRGVGDSTGSLYGSDYHDYAADAAAAVEALRARPDIRPDRIGLIGFSEGEWTAPLAALRAGDIAFIAVIGASGISPARQVNAEIAMRLRRRGHTEEAIADALALNDRVFAYQRTGEGADDLRRRLEEARSKSWFDDAHDIPAEIHPVREYGWWRSVMDFDPSPVWQRITAPVLILKGERDVHSPADIARQEITSALARGGNRDVEFILVADGDHMLLAWPLGEGAPPPVFADDYLKTLIEWIRSKLDDVA
ncbi:MAG: alpha/beta hydrolase [Wenzhouxiangellaceae bacterium]|nr:alpha/beta hydrolase [Wenzhouxiangellaceae bacterium]